MSNKQGFKDGYQPKPDSSRGRNGGAKGGYQPTRSEGGSPANPPPKRK